MRDPRREPDGKMAMRIGDLIHGLDIRLVEPDGRSSAGGAELRICDLTEDSRTVMPGSLFIARAGEKSDGRAFVPQAIEAGAVAVLTDDPGLRLTGAAEHHRGAAVLLVTGDIALATAQLAERFYGSPSSRMAVIGVTGTNGKTTTTFLIHQMLNAMGIRCGLIGTVVIDDGVEVAPASLTTPPALEISRTLATMLEAGCKAAVMEVSSHALHQKRVGAIAFNAGVFTNLTGDHLDYHGTMDAYAAAKAVLFEMLPADGVAVVNIQDPSHSRMVKQTRARILRCAIDGPMPIAGGTAPETICRARVLASDTGGTDIEFTGPWGRQSVRAPLVGMFNVMNALQAVATVHAMFGGTGEDDYSFSIIAEALAHAAPPPGRLEPVTPDGAPLSVFVDYAHTDDALRTVLSTVRGAMNDRAGSTGGKGAVGTGEAGGGRGGRLWCVFGCGGDRDRTKRPRMGAAAAELADPGAIVVTSDNPRTEDPGAIIREIVGGIPAGLVGGVHVEPDREAAIRYAIAQCGPGDAVVIAGKGHEDYQILPDPKRPGMTITRHFDDREVARAALMARGVQPRPMPVVRPPEDASETGDADVQTEASTGLSA